MPNRPISPTSEETFQVSPASQSARMPPTKASGRVARMTRVSAQRAERQVEQHEAPPAAPRRWRSPGERSGPRAPGSRPGRRRRRSSRWAASSFAASRSRTSAAVPPRSRPATLASTAIRRLPASRRMDAGPNVCSMRASWPSGMRVPSWPSISSAPRVALTSRRAASSQPHHEVEPALADPDLRHLLADQPDPHGVDDVAGREADARRRARGSTVTRSCGRPVSCSARRSVTPGTFPMISRASRGQPGQRGRGRGRRSAPGGRPACRRAPRRCACRAAW